MLDIVMLDTEILTAILEQRILVETLDLVNLVAIRDRILVVTLTTDNLPIEYLLVLRTTQGLLPHAPLTNIHPLTIASTIHRPIVSNFNQETATSYPASSDASSTAEISQGRPFLPLSIDEEVEEEDLLVHMMALLANPHSSLACRAGTRSEKALIQSKSSRTLRLRLLKMLKILGA